MKINKVFCLFEQSGTFKNAFRNLGYEAEDFDIRDDFGETDRKIDLFEEINKAYENKPSLFDEIEENDLILAFFPCTRFQAYNCANFQGKNYGMRDWDIERKLLYSMSLHEELHNLYTLISKLFLISIRGGYQMIVENPYTQPHYLTMFFPVEPKIVIQDRYKEGDYFSKPTQFFFVNCRPEQNVVFESILPLEHLTKDQATHIEKNVNTQVKRSLIHPQFADRFIKTYILDKECGLWT